MKKIRARTDNYQRGRTSDIKYIVIHYTATPNDTAHGEATYFKNTYVGASAHYFVDENETVQSVEDGDTAWHCEGADVFYSQCRNSNSIGVEMCCRKYDMTHKRAEDKDWYFTEKTLKNACELVKSLMVKYDISVENVIRHYDVTHKICPAPFVHSEEDWKMFLSCLKGDDDEMVEKSKINVNGKNYEIDRILKDGHNYIRLDCLKSMGFDVGYDPKSKVPSLGVKAEKVAMCVNGKDREISRILKFDENYVRIRDMLDIADIGYINGKVVVESKK